jgi:plasmid maintenance system antidote protein VapI
METTMFTFSMQPHPTYVPITDYVDYEVSDFGQVRKKLQSGTYRYLTNWLNDKHFVATLHKDGAAKNFYVHRLVLQQHGPEQPADMPLALHLDDNPANNEISNIVWGSKRTNAQMAVKNGKLCPHSMKMFLTPQQAQIVRDMFASGKFSMRDIAKEMGCSRWTVSNIVHNRINRLR